MDHERWAGLTDDELTDLSRSLSASETNMELHASLVAERDHRQMTRVRGEKTLSMADVRDWLGRTRASYSSGDAAALALAYLIEDLESRPSLDPEHDRSV